MHAIADALFRRGRLKKSIVLIFFVTAILLQATPTLAIPMLNTSGDGVTGLAVPGFGLFEISFGDGVMGDVFSHVYSGGGLPDEAGAIQNVLAEFLESEWLAVAVSIPGCELRSFPSTCVLSHSSQTSVYNGIKYFQEDRGIHARFNGVGLVRGVVAVRFNNPNAVLWRTGRDITRVTNHTFWTFRSVDLPGSASLVFLALFLFGCRRGA